MTSHCGFIPGVCKAKYQVLEVMCMVRHDVTFSTECTPANWELESGFAKVIPATELLDIKTHCSGADVP